MSNMTSRIDTAEMISLFRKAEEEISRERGDFTLFGLFESLDIFGKYNLIVAASWLKDDRVCANLIFDLIRASIGNDQWFTKVRVGRIVPEDGPFAAAVHEVLPNGPIQHGMKHLTNFFYDGEIIRDAVIITSVEAATENAAQAGKRSEPVAV